MKQYHNAVEKVLTQGNYKKNRTGVDTLSDFSINYEINLQEGFPLLTTKKMDGFRWNSLLHEICWYFSGQHHVRELSEKTGIWDAWADENKNLPTAYGRFWRRFPIPEDKQKLPGEWWAGDEDWFENAEEWYGDKPESDEISAWINEEENGAKTFDQLKYVIDTLNGKHPNRSKNSRRLVVSAWHPANAAVSKLPPCHFTFVLNVQNGKLNTHLTQRSGDMALGVPFNIASYAALTKILAMRTGLNLGSFSHTIVDAHIYCGKDERGTWYEDNLDSLKKKLDNTETKDYSKLADFIEKKSPNQQKVYDHVPGLLRQISRNTLDRPELEIENKKIGKLERDDFQLKNYKSHDPIKFDVAE